MDNPLKSIKRSSVLPAQHRESSLDALRGVAMVWMTVFHFCFDLASLGFWQQNFYADPFWTWQRNCIVGLFLLCAGMGQAYAVAAGQSWARFGRRWLQIAGCAALVSAGSYLMYPKSFIYFGVLHSLCVSLLFVRLLVPLGQWLWVLAFGVLVAWLLGTQAMVGSGLEAALNSKPFSVFGIISQKPITEDYVPLLPWLAVLFAGAALGNGVLPKPGAAGKHTGLVKPFTALKPLAWLGRWSLSYYMVHQPVLIGMLLVFRWCAGQ